MFFSITHDLADVSSQFKRKKRSSGLEITVSKPLGVVKIDQKYQLKLFIYIEIRNVYSLR